MRFVKVTSIKPAGKQDVYDISMADTEDPSFIANGIVVHNSYASAESAMSVFLETCNSYRQHFTHAIFDTSLFPLIAVANDMYKNKGNKVRNGDISGYLANSSNRQNLRLPTVMWHKSLEPKGEENMMDMLDKLSEKGVPVALKMWMAAAGVDEETLLKDLKSDKELRAQLQQYTGKDTSHEGEDQDSGGDAPDGVDDDLAYAGFSERLASTSFKSRPAMKRSILSRNWGQSGEIKGETKTGKPKYILNQKDAQRAMNMKIAKIAKDIRDPNYAAQLKAKNKTILGHTAIPGAGDIRSAK